MEPQELAKTKLHGIVIPVAFILFGTAILNYEYLPYAVALAVVLCSFNLYMAYVNLSSMHPVKWNDFELIDKTIISRNSAIYRFKLFNEEETLHVLPGQNIACCFTIDGKDEVRYYSPLSNKFDAGFFDILVKSYPNGLISSKFAQLKEGQAVKFRGLVGRLEYKPNMAKEIALVAGGSGITPMLQLITEVITTPEDFTKISLIYANETEEDILLKGEIDEIASRYPNFRVHYTLTQPKNGWVGSKGFVTNEMMKTHLPSLATENRLFICGPPLMRQHVLEIATNLGWKVGDVMSTEEQVFFF